MKTSIPFEVVTTPTWAWLRANLKNCTKRLTVASPFVNNALLDIVHGVPGDVRKRLLTRTKVEDFAGRASNLDTLDTLVEEGINVCTLATLHAKVYVLDARLALVTSANATNAGMRRNRECGIALHDRAASADLERLVLSGFGAEHRPTRVNAGFLSQLRGSVRALRLKYPEKPHVQPARGKKRSGVDFEAPLEIADYDGLLSAQRGWTRLTLECVLGLPKERFSLKEINAVAVPAGEKRYPKNNWVPDQIRKQLQLLRDMGIIEFEKPGHYRRLVNLRGKNSNEDDL